MRTTHGQVAILAISLLIAAGVIVGWTTFAADKKNPGPDKRADKKEKGGEAANRENQPARFALLVGCTKYPNVREPDKAALIGPANDVVLMERLLRARFGFKEQDIVILSEAAGEKDKDRVPARANIEREFVRLAHEAGAGARVVIYLSGHGSQQPERDPPPDPQFAEPDGLDELFLPRDVKPWDEKEKTIPNAIIDDEFREWTGKILAKGADVWFIADCCHSGTLLRGSPEEVVRELRPEEDLGIPKRFIQEARARAKKRDERPRDEPAAPFKLEKGSERLAAIYAAQPDEVTFEFPLPQGEKGAKPHGLLTYTLCQVLFRSETPPTHRELLARIRSEYDVHNRRFPTPLAEGNNLDRIVLGDKEFPGRSRLVLRKQPDGWVVTGGQLNGLTRDSILAVFRDGDSKKPMGHVKVVESRLLEAEVKACAFAGLPPPADLPAAGRCEIVFLQYDVHFRVIDPTPAELRLAD